MRAHRHHADVVIAALILLGVVTWLGGLVNYVTDPSRLVKGIVWFAAAFSAAQLARSVLADLDIGEVAIAAMLTVSIAIGLHDHRVGKDLSLDILVPIGIAIAGAVAGGYTARAREARIFLVLAAGAGGFGAAVLGIAMSVLLDGSRGAIGLAVIFGSVAGGVIAALLIPAVRRLHCALGQALLLGALIAVFERSHVLGAVFGAMFGFVLGGIGGAIGQGIRDRRDRRDPAPELPEVRQVR